MAFTAYQFSFNGVPSYEYGLMIYDFDSSSQGESNNSSPINIVEDRIANRYSSLYYGATQNTPLEFNLIFGADVNAVEQEQHLDRWDLNVIGTWLTGVDGYKWLDIEQSDMETVRYKCIISELKIIDIGNLPWALSCKVTCDSPFGYLYPEVFNYSVTTNKTISIQNKSSYMGYYYPELSITIPSGVTSISIKNTTDNNREFKFSGFTNTTGMTVTIDNQNQIITSSAGANMYPYFNFNFFRLVKGDNSILITGDCSIMITCLFPVNIGG